MNTVQKALTFAIHMLDVLQTSGLNLNPGGAKVKADLEAALADIEKCEPDAEAIRERDRLGFAVVNVIGKLDEIIDATQEVEIDDFLHIAVPIDMWNELQDALEDMPKRADLYTSPQPREWVELSSEQVDKIWNESSGRFVDTVKAINDELKQLNMKG